MDGGLEAANFFAAITSANVEDVTEGAKKALCASHWRSTVWWLKGFSPTNMMLVTTFVLGKVDDEVKKTLQTGAEEMKSGHEEGKLPKQKVAEFKEQLVVAISNSGFGSPAARHYQTYPWRRWFF